VVFLIPPGTNHYPKPLSHWVPIIVLPLKNGWFVQWSNHMVSSSACIQLVNIFYILVQCYEQVSMDI
jgi:hypothetical protein